MAPEFQNFAKKTISKIFIGARMKKKWDRKEEDNIIYMRSIYEVKYSMNLTL